jgi:hypothetical protein
MLLSFAYLAFSAVLQWLLGRRRTSSPKTLSYPCCDINSSCSGGRSGALRCGRPIGPCLRRSPERFHSRVDTDLIVTPEGFQNAGSAYYSAVALSSLVAPFTG